MLIAVISDTHGNSDAIDRAIELAKDADVLIHLGDVISDVKYIRRIFGNRIIYVPGNCDYNSYEDREKVVELDGVRFLLCHGDKYRVDMGLISLKYRAKELGAKVALFGHTHRSVVVEDEGVVFMNPGSPSMPRDLTKSIGFINIKDGEIHSYIKKL